MTGLEFTVVFMVIAVTVVVLGLLILATIKLGVGIFKVIGLIFGRILEFIGGILGDTRARVAVSLWLREVEKKQALRSSAAMPRWPRVVVW